MIREVMEGQCGREIWKVRLFWAIHNPQQISKGRFLSFYGQALVRQFHEASITEAPCHLVKK